MVEKYGMIKGLIWGLSVLKKEIFGENVFKLPFRNSTFKFTSKSKSSIYKLCVSGFMISDTK